MAFQLDAFPGMPAPPGLQISGEATRQAERLRLLYRLSGALAGLHVPPTEAKPQRLDDLWQSTCLECFLARPDDAGYWELNLSPAGHWNLYRLEGYRLGLQPQPGTQAPVLARSLAADELAIAVELILPGPLAAAPVLEVGITAVIADRQAALSYWALRHPGEQADFHRREGFALRL